MSNTEHDYHLANRLDIGDGRHYPVTHGYGRGSNAYCRSPSKLDGTGKGTNCGFWQDSKSRPNNGGGLGTGAGTNDCAGWGRSRNV